MAVSFRHLLKAVPVLKNSLSVVPSCLYNGLIPKQQRLQFCSQQRQTLEEVNVWKNNETAQEVFAKVNDQIANKSHGRLFAVVYICSTQYKITTDDIIVVRASFPPTVGDKIRLEKVLLVGSSDFTLIGRPLLPLDQVEVHATVIEKTLSHTQPIFRFQKRHNHMKCNFYKIELTYLRINSINLTGKVNELGDSDGLKNRLF